MVLPSNDDCHEITIPVPVDWPLIVKAAVVPLQIGIAVVEEILPAIGLETVIVITAVVALEHVVPLPFVLSTSTL